MSEAQSWTLTAPIVAVEVFRSAALVRRRGRVGEAVSGEVGVDPASSVLELRGLPMGLIDSSLRVGIAPKDSCRVMDLHVALQIQPPVASEPAPAVLEEVKRLRRELLQREQRRATVARQAEELMRLHPLLPPSPRQPDRARFAVDDPAPAWLALARFTRARAAVALAEVQRLDAELRDLGVELRAAQERASAMSSQERRVLEISKCLRVRLSGRPAPDAVAEISYLVPGARWYPSYELRVEEGGQRAELVLGALLAQSTGEDWGAVELALSTADLQRRCDLPELGAWRIGRVQPRERRAAWRPLPGDLPSLFADYDRERPPPQLPLPAIGIELPGRGLVGVHATSSPTQVMERPELRQALIQTTPYNADERTPSGGSGGAWDGGATTLRAQAAGELSLDEPAVDAVDEMDDHLVTAEEADEGFISEDFGLPAAPSAARGPEIPADVPAAAPMAPRAMAALRDSEVVTAPLARPMISAQAAAHPWLDDRIAELPAEPWPDSSLTKRERELDAVPTAQAAPNEDLIAYGGLVLAGADEHGRGGLRLPHAQELLPAEWRGSPEAASALGLTDFNRARGLTDLEGLPLPPHVVPIWESAGHFAHRYTTTLASGVPADGQLHRVAVMRTNLPVRTIHRAIPLCDPAVYRLATLTNPLDRPLLAGPLDVFWGRDFLVTGQLETTAAGAAIEANLGVEPRIKVARNVTHTQREGGLLGGRTLIDEEIAVDVESHLPHEGVLEIIERVPLSDDRKLEIKLTQESPATQPYEQRERGRPIRGGRRFQLRLQPGARARCVLGYQLVLPAKNEIVGGSRRVR